LRFSDLVNDGHDRPLVTNPARRPPARRDSPIDRDNIRPANRPVDAPLPSASGRDEAVGIDPLLELLLELLALVDDDLPVVGQRDLEPFERPRRGAFEVHARDVEPAAVAGALELLLAREPVRRATQVGADRLERIDDVLPVVTGRPYEPEAPFGLE